MLTVSPAGEEIKLTFENRKVFAASAIKSRLHEANQQIGAVLEGMASIVPAPLFRFMTGEALETWVCGKPEIDVNLLMKIVR